MHITRSFLAHFTRFVGENQIRLGLRKPNENSKLQEIILVVWIIIGSRHKKHDPATPG